MNDALGFRVHVRPDANPGDVTRMSALWDALGVTIEVLPSDTGGDESRIGYTDRLAVEIHAYFQIYAAPEVWTEKEARRLAEWLALQDDWRR